MKTLSLPSSVSKPKKPFWAIQTNQTISARASALNSAPSFGGNLALLNTGSSTFTFTFTSDKAIRSKLYIRLANQNYNKEDGLLSNYDITINGKHFVDLTQRFDPSTGEAAEGSDAAYFTMVTLETKISLKNGENVVVITPVTANYLNLDYIEIDTSAVLEDTTESTVQSANFITITKKPTESAKGTIVPACTQEGCTKTKARDLPTVSHKIYTRTDTADKATYSIEILGTQIEVVSTTYKLTVQGKGVTFHNGKTTDFVIPGSQIEFVYEEPDGQIFGHWADSEGVDLGETFVMPENNITIKPVFIDAVPATVTLQGATLNGSATVETYVGKKIDLTGIELEVDVPEDKVFKGWSVLTDKTKIYTETYTVTGTVTRVPVFDARSDNFYSKTNYTGKITPVSNSYVVKNCYLICDNKITGAVKGEDGTYEAGCIYRYKGGTADAPAEKLEAGAYFVTPEMNGLTALSNVKKTVTTTVENFGTEDITLKFALTTSSGSPVGSVYGEKTVTIKAGECLTFSFDVEKVHNSIMNFVTVQNEVSEIFIGMYQYITDNVA